MSLTDKIERVTETYIFWTSFMIIAFIGIILNELLNINIILLLLSSILAIKAVIGLRQGKINVDTLMSIVGFVTYFINAINEGLIVYILYGIAEFLEKQAEKWATRKIRGLLDLIPQKTTKIKGEKTETVNVKEVKPGEILLVKPGETVPIDGVIVDEQGVFDTHIITGESMPVRLRKGDRVDSGYIVLQSPVKIKTLKKPEESTTQMMIREINRALQTKTRTQRYIEKIMKPYTLILLGAFITASLILSPYRGLSIILAGCPSALIISSSVGTIATIGRMALKGAIIRGGSPLEKMTEIDTVVFDKTGTLTIGDLEIDRIETYNNMDKETILRMASIASKISNHPIAKALSKHTDKIPDKAEEIPGKGIIAWIDSKQIVLGNRELIKEKIKSDIEEEASDGSTVYIAINNVLVGKIVLREKIRPEAKKVIEQLKEKGIKVILISGDKKQRVEKISSLLGIKEYYYEKKPEGKVQLIRELKTQGKKVAMVGDGINDALAMSEAHVGISMGEYTLVAETADIVLMRNNLELIPELLDISNKRRDTLTTSYGIAITIKVLTIILGISGIIPLWTVAALGDDGSTVFSLIPLIRLIK